MVMNAKVTTSVMVPCGWCSQLIKRKKSEIKNFKAAYCRPDHYQFAMTKKRHEEKLAKKTTEKDAMFLYCEICKDVTTHTTESIDLAKCTQCETLKSSRISISREMATTGSSNK